MSRKALLKERSAISMYSSSVTALCRLSGISGLNVNGVLFCFVRVCQARFAAPCAKSRHLNWLETNWLLMCPKCCSMLSSVDRHGHQTSSSPNDVHAIATEPHNSWRFDCVTLASHKRLLGTFRSRLLSSATSSQRSRSTKELRQFSNR